MNFLCNEPSETCPRYQEIRVLYDISLTLGGGLLGIQKSFEEALSLIKKHFFMDKCMYYALNDEADTLDVFASAGLNKKQEMLASYRVGEGATGIAAQSKEPIVIENVHKNILFLNKSGSLSDSEISYLAIPAVSQNTLFGVLGASLTKKSISDIEEMITILSVAASFMAQSMRIHRTISDEKKRLSDEKLYYKEEILRPKDIIGSSAQIKAVLDIIEKIAPSSATVLINGETGTGKELVAKAIHTCSPRKDKPYVKLNCAAIPEHLLESELFGHEKGAFTDAKEMRKGRFELADTGTLFLDEVGDLSLPLQAKLLRILQEQEFERVGGAKTIKVDVRIVAATNRNLRTMVAEGSFREDLFYRLNVIPIYSPPLRTRGDDIVILARHFLEYFCKRHGKRLTLSDDAEEILKEYNWPGNIRELENCMERIVLLSTSSCVEKNVFLSVLPAKTEDLPKEVETQADLEDLERKTIIRVLRECEGVKLRAARKLGITNRQIGYKIQKFAISAGEYR